MTDRAIWHVVADLRNPKSEPFAVLRVNTSVRSGDGVEGTVVSLHWNHEEAQERAKELDEELCPPRAVSFTPAESKGL